MPPACKAYGYSCEDDSFSLGGLLDIPGMVEDAITGFLGSLVEQVMKPVREMLADTLLATPDVTSQGDVKQLWTTMLGITGGLYVLFVTAGGITVMGYEAVQARYALKQIAPRLLMGMVAAATSLTVMGKAIGLSNAVAHAIMATDMSDAAQGAIKRALPLPTNPSSELLLVILGLVAGVLVLATLIGFLVRVAVMALLAVCAPLALACHAHPLADPIARMWWRGAGGVPGHPGDPVDDLHPLAEAVLRPWRHLAGAAHVGRAGHDAGGPRPVLGAVQDPGLDAPGRPARFARPAAARARTGAHAQTPGDVPAPGSVRIRSATAREARPPNWWARPWRWRPARTWRQAAGRWRAPRRPSECWRSGTRGRVSASGQGARAP